MKIVLRALAIFEAYYVLFTAFMAFWLFQHKALHIVVTRTPRLVMTLVECGLVLCIGPLAAVQLWRLKPSGRIATMILFGSAVCYHLVDLLFFLGLQAGRIVLSIFVYSALFILMCTQWVRRLCSADLLVTKEAF